MSVKLKQEIYETLPMGQYSATITDIEETEGHYGPQLAFTFTVAGGEHDGALLKGWTSAKFSNKSKLYAWTKAAFGGADIPEDYTFDSDHLLSRKVTLGVIIRVKPEDGTEFNRVDSVMPFNGTPVPAPAASGQPAFPPMAEEDDIPF
jgi:hypothetical protein